MIDPLDRAGLHPITHDGPAIDFFAGALLGNGGLGAVVCTRPDALVIRFGHNDVWDIRIAEANQEKIGTFDEVFARVRAIDPALARLEDDAWFRQYCQMTAANYGKTYPRPFPCGSLILGFDSRHTEVLGHSLDLATGICEVRLLAHGEKRFARIFVERPADRLWVGVFDAAGQPANSPFVRVRLLPDPEAANDMPKHSVLVDEAQRSLSFRQILPAAEPDVYDAQNGHPDDRAVRLSVKVSSALTARQRPNWRSTCRIGMVRR